MKKYAVLAVLPIFLFALETVNLIKDHSFEKDSDVWHTKLTGTGYPNIFAEVSRHDSERAFVGSYSGSGDNRPLPDDVYDTYNENTFITQGFHPWKTVEDIDSLVLNYLIFPRNNQFDQSYCTPVYLYINADEVDFLKVGYFLKAQDLPSTMTLPYINLGVVDFETDTFWHVLERNVFEDISEYDIHSIPTDATLDSIILWGVSNSSPYGYWRGQKVFWDDVRLMGYADYDVGVKSILDPVESCEQSPYGNSSLVPSYTPTALVKNFGRENAEFAVIAEIYDGDTQVYYDSLDWSLTSDTEDTVTFASFTPPDTGVYTLTIRTFMELDESDADDQLSKELDFTGVSEYPAPFNLSLDIANTLTSSSPLRVSYSLPANQTGTLSVYDPSGRRIQRQAVTGMGKLDLNIQLPAGVYIVRLESGGEAVSHKAVVLN